MQIADKTVCMPANWPDNKLIGDEVIIPPPQTLKHQKKGLKKLKLVNLLVMTGGSAIKTVTKI